jgi:glycosyltransferase involved in cell wall biosynthesis
MPEMQDEKTSLIVKEVAEPAVTIGLPLYNDEAYLSRALDSLLAQTFTDFRIVISDNGSTDGSPDICAAYLKKDHRIQYVRHPRNQGPMENFLFLFYGAIGPFFMWAASDDEWHPDFLRLCVEALRSDPGCAVAFGRFITIDEEGRTVGRVLDFDFSGYTPLVRLLRFSGNFYAGRDAFWYGLYRRDLISDLRIRYWWGINANNYANIAYPTLLFVLTRGNYRRVGSQPLWRNRVHMQGKARHSAVFLGQPFVGFFAAILRQVNLACYSLSEISRAGNSVILTAAAFPIVVSRCCADIAWGSAQLFFLAISGKWKKLVSVKMR